MMRNPFRIFSAALRASAPLRLTKRLAKRGRSFETTEGTELILPVLCIHVQKNIREM